MVKFRPRMEGNSSATRKQAGDQDQLPHLERNGELDAKAKWRETEAEGRENEIGGRDAVLEISAEPDRRIWPHCEAGISGRGVLERTWDAEIACEV